MDEVLILAKRAYEDHDYKRVISFCKSRREMNIAISLGLEHINVQWYKCLYSKFCDDFSQVAKVADQLTSWDLVIDNPFWIKLIRLENDDIIKPEREDPAKLVKMKERGASYATIGRRFGFSGNKAKDIIRTHERSTK